jgi:hypothetical protein
MALNGAGDGLALVTRGLEGSGGGGEYPTAEEIAAAVWDAVIADYQDAGSAGLELSDAKKAAKTAIAVSL